MGSWGGGEGKRVGESSNGALYTQGQHRADAENDTCLELACREVRGLCAQAPARSRAGWRRSVDGVQRRDGAVQACCCAKNELDIAHIRSSREGEVAAQRQARREGKSRACMGGGWGGQPTFNNYHPFLPTNIWLKTWLPKTKPRCLVTLDDGLPSLSPSPHCYIAVYLPHNHPTAHPPHPPTHPPTTSTLSTLSTIPTLFRTLPHQS